jgi:hypothetical protein
MISYYCHFGDNEIGKFFAKILFGKIKAISFLESKLNPKDFSQDVSKIVIRFFVDGNITLYTEIEDSNIFFIKKEKCFFINYHLNHDKVKGLNINETFDYIKQKTISSIDLVKATCEKKKMDFHNEAKLKRSIDEIFEMILEKNVLE